MTFQNNFLWGGALSNVQAEGAYLTDGKGLNVYDTFEVKKEKGQKEVNGTDLASNHYYQYKEDIALMKEMSFKAYRFSIVWSRIHPLGDEAEPNEEGLAFYEDMIDELLKANIEPVVSLVHFDMPDNLVKKYNGFHSSEVVDFYVNHVEQVVERFKSKVKYWITYNEMNTAPSHSGMVAGAKKPADESNVEFFSKIVHHTQVAHARAVLAIKSANPDAKVSGMINYCPLFPKTTSPKDIKATSIANNYVSFLTFDIMTDGKYPEYYEAFLRNRGITLSDPNGFEDIKNAAKRLDYLAFSYYLTGLISAPENAKDYLDFEDQVVFSTEISMSEYIPQTKWGWGIDPEGFRTALTTLYQRYHKPIFVVENGIALEEKLNEQLTVEDDERIEFYKNHISSMHDAIKYEGVDVVGYLAWAPIDFLSSHKEMEKRYGFVFIDTKMENGELKRYPKKSFNWYKKVIESKGEDLENE